MTYEEEQAEIERIISSMIDDIDELLSPVFDVRHITHRWENGIVEIYLFLGGDVKMEFTFDEVLFISLTITDSYVCREMGMFNAHHTIKGHKWEKQKPEILPACLKMHSELTNDISAIRKRMIDSNYQQMIRDGFRAPRDDIRKKVKKQMRVFDRALQILKLVKKNSDQG